MGFLLRAGVAPPDGLRLSRPGALTTLSRVEGAEVAVVHGDLLDPTFALPPAGTPPQEIVRRAARVFARHCGVVVSGASAALWTDHGALCPLHHTRDRDGRLVVAPSAAALLPLLGRPPRLATGPRRPTRTGLAGVASVAAGTLVFLPVRAPEPVTTVVHFRLPAPHPVAPGHAVRDVGAVLGRAVAGLVGGGDAAGMLLSGGVDSSTVAALARPRVTTLRTYTVGTPFGDEFPAARRVARHLGSDHVELRFTPDDLRRSLPRMVRLLETWELDTLRICAPICFALDRLRGVERVLLTGYGADLLFAGTGGSGSHPQIERALRRGVVATGCSNEFSPAVADANGILVRHPYWTAPVIGTALAIPVTLKLRDGTVKWVLRQAAAQVLPPDVADRPKVAIQDGTAMERMFAAALATADPADQARRLRSIADAVLASGAPGGQPNEVEIDAHPVGVAS